MHIVAKRDVSDSELAVTGDWLVRQFTIFEVPLEKWNPANPAVSHCTGGGSIHQH